MFNKRKKQGCNTKPQNKENTRLIIITGCAGSGKTTIGKELARDLGYTYIDKDTVTRDFTDFVLERSGSSKGDRESNLYREELLPIEYKTTFKLCREILDNGCNVIVTIPFISQIRDYSKWEEIRAEAKIKSHEVRFVWIEHNLETEHENIKKRGAERDNYKLAHWENYSAGIEGIAPAEEYQAYIYTNDCNINLSTAVIDLKKWIKR